MFSRIKTKNKTIMAIVLAVFLFIGLLVFLRMSEDTWICDNGTWVKHGVPSDPMPTSICK